MKIIKKYTDFVFEQGGLKKAPTTTQKVAPKSAAEPKAQATPTISAADLAKEKADLTLKLNTGFEKLSNWLKGMFSSENANQWEPWKTFSNDKEEQAWTDFFLVQWNAECAQTLKELQAAVKLLQEAVKPGAKYANDGNMVQLETKMSGNLKIVESWTTATGAGSLYLAFHNASPFEDDIYRWTMNYSDDHTTKGRKTYDVDCDF
jgi:hypothetical protein